MQIYFVRFCEVDTSENWLWGWQCEAVIGFWRQKWLKIDVVSWFVGFEIQNACGKNKQMDQLKWWTIVKKLRRQIKANLARELAQKHELATNPETSSDESDQEGYL